MSQRTDNQPVDVPNVGDSEDLNQGDRQRLEAAQRLAPVPRGQGPVTGQRQGETRGAGSVRGDDALPPSLFEELSKRPGEPTTEGLDRGAGADSSILPQPPPVDDRELILEYYTQNYSNPDTAQLLQEMRMPPPDVPVAAPMVPTEPTVPEPEGNLRPEEDLIDLDAEIEAETAQIPTEADEATETLGEGRPEPTAEGDEVGPSTAAPIPEEAGE